jgi:hypothetical protein
MTSKDYQGKDEVLEYWGIMDAEGEYSIIRFYPNAPSKIMSSGWTREEARAHCNREYTHGDEWFDGYTLSEFVSSKKQQEIHRTMTNEECSICSGKIGIQYCPETGTALWSKGHNAKPYNGGKCCTTCKLTRVIPERLRQARLARTHIQIDVLKE